MTEPAAASAPDERERLALRVSVVASVIIGLVGIVWGLAVGSRIMLFDGVYTFIGTALSTLSLLAAWISTRAASREYPFGLQAAVPIAILVQGAALLGTLVFAFVDSVGLLFTGGTGAPEAAVIGYALVAAAFSLVTIVVLPRLGPGSELVAAEAAQWRAGAILSLLIGVGAAATMGLVALGVDWLAPYGDPLLVIIAALALSPVAFGLVRAGGREMLEAAPPAEIQQLIEDAAARTSAEHDLGEPIIRATKLGRRIYLEVDYVVDPGEWDVAGEDAVRRDVLARLAGLDYELWANIEITGDPTLAE